VIRYIHPTNLHLCSNFKVSIAMSKPTAGNYYIINRLLSPTGEKLAITFNGQEQTTTLTPMASLASQIV
jgi:hypothetical protein